MKASIREEFKQRAIDYVNDGVLTNDNKEEWHFYLFNEDYYIIGYYKAEQWLKKHDVSPFEAIGTIQDYEHLNALRTNEIGYANSEAVVNAYTYVLGEQWMMEEGEEFIQNYIH